MNAKVATGLFALALMFTGTVSAQEILKDKGILLTGPNGKDVACNVTYLEKKDKNGDGLYTIQNVSSGNGYLYARNSDEGTAVSWDKSNKTIWILHLNGNGRWSIMHSENGANALSQNSDGSMKLRRNNAGGRGNADQLWHIH